ncbi:hypothetical protein JTE90_023897 [Oedothorax gibbosus]|uniref:Piwi domain-containing protein n=1 Tax=Oedothorax gibbosus TaxID=931172 RepID=A0AAV6UNV2_9ARAC|nr:hypothetical protein JTE90_023897 [Oedothorax gibbosus]
MPPPPQRGRGRGYQDDRQGGGGGQRGGGGRGRGYQDDRQGGGGQWGGGGRGRGYQDDRQGGGGGRGRGYQDDRQGQRGGGGGYRGRGAPRGRQDRGGYGQSRGGYGGGGDRYAAQSRQQWNPFPEGPGSHPKREKVKYKGADLGIEIKLSLQDSNNMPKKPPPGKLGQKIKLMSNCFAMKAPSGYVYHYDVEVCNNNRQSTTTGKETAKSKKYVCLNTKRNREVIDKLLSTNPLFEGAYGAYDGKKNLLCRSKLNIVGEDLKCAVHVPKRDSIPVPGTEQQMDEFEVVLKPVRKKESNDCAINLDTLHAVYADVLKSPPQDAVMALETILRHGPCMRFTPVGRSFFYPPLDTDLHPLGGGLEIWFGYHQSVRLGEWSPIVNLDVSSTAFHQAKKMIDLIADVLEVDPQGLHNMGTMRDYQRKAIDKKYRNMQIETLVEVANKEGIEIEPATNIQTFNPHQSSMVDILGNAKKRFKADLAVLVLPGGKAKDSIYKDIKQAAETGVGLVTQCIIDKNLTDRKDKTKCSLQLVSNLCQKINAKMGGVNNSLISGEMPAIFREPVMIIGADVTHSSPAGDLHDGISIAAVVASLDKHPSRYAVSIRAQKHRDENKESLEIIVELDKMVEELLLAFFRHTKQKKPRRIVFYRDGVSEGQFNKVREKEMSAVRRACKRVQNDGYEPPITFIVVQKRHHTRFMPSDERDGTGRMKNIPPGTTIDTVVTHPLYFDFFQCSHTGIQGTSKPCHYTVLHDDNNFSADDLQKLTFYLCHTYARCTRSIACPPPVMYADLAAYRAGKYLSEEEGSSSGSSVGGASRSSKQSKSSSLTSEQLLAKVQKEIKTIDFLADTMYFV